MFFIFFSFQRVSKGLHTSVPFWVFKIKTRARKFQNNLYIFKRRIGKIKSLTSRGESHQDWYTFRFDNLCAKVYGKGGIYIFFSWFQSTFMALDMRRIW